MMFKRTWQSGSLRKQRRGRVRRPLPGVTPHEPLEGRQLLAVFVVNSVDDDGAGTLRDAITQANATAGADEIQFAIPDVAGAPVIKLVSALPSITEQLAIDGGSQPLAGTVTLDGSGAAGADGLVFNQTASGSSVSDLTIGGFANGIRLIAADEISVIDCMVGGSVKNTLNGLLIAGGSGNLLLRVDATNNTLNGVTLDGAIDTQILGSALDGNGAHGLQVIGGDATIVSVSLAGDAASASSNGQSGIVATNTTSLSVLGATVQKNAVDGVLVTGGSGVVVLGSKVSENAVAGLRIDGGSAHAIGGSGINEGNQVTKNGSHGILIKGGATDVTVQRNLVGADISLTDLGNAGDGIRLEGATGAIVTYRNVVAYNKLVGVRVTGGSGNRIGADESRPEGEQGQLFGNTVILNAGGGIHVSGAAGTVISANAVGVSGVGGPVAGNTGDGINVANSTATIIGGSLPVLVGDPNFGNVIAGNTKNGIALVGNVAVTVADATIVRGNTVRGNTTAGILISNSQLQVVGGNIDDTVPDIDETANTIIANGIGVTIEGGGSNEVAGNFIGTDRAATAGLGNAAAGVRILDSSGNIVGGDSEAGEGNVIANNRGDGILVTTVDDGAVVDSEAAFANVVYGNVISGNAGNGVTVQAATGNAIGRNVPGEGNEIIANRGHGVAIVSGADGNVVSANLIGTNAAGSTTVGNAGSGVYVSASVGNTIGGAASGAGNTIARNAAGVRIETAAATPATGNRVLGNTVERNLAEGVRITSSRYTAVGGDGEGEGNAIWLNGGDGVLLDGTASQVRVVGNQIGTDAEGNNLGNAGDGVQVGVANAAVADNSVRFNTIGTNAGAGIRLVNAVRTAIGGTSATDVNTVVLNGEGGVVLQTGSRSNTITGNVVSENLVAGVVLDRSSANTLTGNAVSGNAGTGISLVAASDNVLGGSGASAGNAVADNAGDGIALSGSSNRNRLVANLIDGNDGNGISVQSSVANQITGGNIVTRSGGAGILLAGVTRNTLVADGYVGTDATEDALGNSGHGIAISGAITNVITNMVVANNAGNGIDISASTAAARTAGNIVKGSVITGNKLAGVRVIGGAAHTIGAADAPNTISANFSHGIHLAGRTAGNAVVANAIGENNGDGILIDGGLGNLIEGGNAITLNAGDGIRLVAGAANNVISANFIGTDADGTVDLGNAGDGVEINTGLANVVAANVIADHTAEGARGIAIVGSRAQLPLESRSQAQGKAVRGNLVQSNRLFGNYVGVSVSNSAFQTIGSSTPSTVAPGTTANTVVGSVSHGIAVQGGSTATLILGNYVGTDSAAVDTLGNGGDGIRISASTASLVAGNAVGFNAGHGIGLSGAAAVSAGQANTLRANTISANVGSGVRLGEGSSFNVVGAVGAGNVIRENGSHGVVVEGLSNSNQFVSNSITDNAADGIRIAGSLGSVVRGGTISDNAGVGVRVADALARTVAAGNQVLGARISGNAGEGIRIEGGGRHTVGLAGAGNTITANGAGDLEGASGAGIAIVAGGDGRGSVGNVIRANLIGADSLGTVAGNVGEGILVELGSATEISTGNRIANNGGGAGGAGIRLRGAVGTIVGGVTAALGNTIEANAGDGVLMEEFAGRGSATNLVSGNRIDGNGGNGVAIAGATSNGNVIGMQLDRTTVRGVGNVISNNNASGVGVSTAVRNTILGNSIFGNAEAITLADGANAGMPAPVILSAVASPAGTRTRWTITGAITGAPARQSVVVEIFANPPADDPAQARVLIGRVVVRTSDAGGGSFRVVLTAVAGPTSTITATATSGTGNTSVVGGLAVL